MALPFPPQSLNPGANGNGGQNIVQWLAYEPLIWANSDGTYSPGLATSWEYVGAGNTQFDMQIRTDAKFADGTPVTADAVVATLNYYLEHPAALSHFLTGISEVTASGDTVSVALDAPNPILPLVFSQAVNWGDIISPAGLAAPDRLTQEMFGAGAYTMDTAATVVNDHYTFEKNPNYWNPEAQNYDTVVVTVIPDTNSALQALSSGQIDVYLGGTGAQVEQAESSGLDWVAGTPYVISLFLMDRAGELSPELGDVRVRQALNFAVDRASIAEALGAGYDPTAQISPQGLDGYDPALEEMYPYDPEKAKQLLADAGYPQGFTLKLLDVSIFGIDTVSQAVQQQLADVGVTVEITNEGTDLNKLIADMASKQFGAVNFVLAGPMFANALQNFATPVSPLNPFKSADPTITAAFDALAAAPEDQQASAALTLNQVIVEQAWFVPVVLSQSYMFATGVSNLGELGAAGGIDVLAWSP